MVGKKALVAMTCALDCCVANDVSKMERRPQSERLKYEATPWTCLRSTKVIFCCFLVIHAQTQQHQGADLDVVRPTNFSTPPTSYTTNGLIELLGLQETRQRENAPLDSPKANSDNVLYWHENAKEPTYQLSDNNQFSKLMQTLTRDMRPTTRTASSPVFRLPGWEITPHPCTAHYRKKITREQHLMKLALQSFLHSSRAPTRIVFHLPGCLHLWSRLLIKVTSGNGTLLCTFGTRVVSIDLTKSLSGPISMILTADRMLVLEWNSFPFHRLEEKDGSKRCIIFVYREKMFYIGKQLVEICNNRNDKLCFWLPLRSSANSPICQAVVDYLLVHRVFSNGSRLSVKQLSGHNTKICVQVAQCMIHEPRPRRQRLLDKRLFERVTKGNQLLDKRMFERVTKSNQLLYKRLFERVTKSNQLLDKRMFERVTKGNQLLDKRTNGVTKGNVRKVIKYEDCCVLSSALEKICRQICGRVTKRYDSARGFAATPCGCGTGWSMMRRCWLETDAFLRAAVHLLAPSDSPAWLTISIRWKIMTNLSYHHFDYILGKSRLHQATPHGSIKQGFLKHILKMSTEKRKLSNSKLFQESTTELPENKQQHTKQYRNYGNGNLRHPSNNLKTSPDENVQYWPAAIGDYHQVRGQIQQAPESFIDPSNVRPGETRKISSGYARLHHGQERVGGRPAERVQVVGSSQNVFRREGSPDNRELQSKKDTRKHISLLVKVTGGSNNNKSATGDPPTRRTNFMFANTDRSFFNTSVELETDNKGRSIYSTLRQSLLPDRKLNKGRSIYSTLRQSLLPDRKLNSRDIFIGISLGLYRPGHNFVYPLTKGRRNTKEGDADWLRRLYPANLTHALLRNSGTIPFSSQSDNQDSEKVNMKSKNSYLFYWQKVMNVLPGNSPRLVWHHLLTSTNTSELEPQLSTSNALTAILTYMSTSKAKHPMALKSSLLRAKHQMALKSSLLEAEHPMALKYSPMGAKPPMALKSSPMGAKHPMALKSSPMGAKHPMALKSSPMGAKPSMALKSSPMGAKPPMALKSSLPRKHKYYQRLFIKRYKRQINLQSDFFVKADMLKDVYLRWLDIKREGNALEGLILSSVRRCTAAESHMVQLIKRGEALTEAHKKVETYNKLKLYVTQQDSNRVWRQFQKMKNQIYRLQHKGEIAEKNIRMTKAQEKLTIDKVSIKEGKVADNRTVNKVQPAQNSTSTPPTGAAEHQDTPLDNDHSSAESVSHSRSWPIKGLVDFPVDDSDLMHVDKMLKTVILGEKGNAHEDKLGGESSSLVDDIEEGVHFKSSEVNPFLVENMAGPHGGVLAMADFMSQDRDLERDSHEIFSKKNEEIEQPLFFQEPSQFFVQQSKPDFVLWSKLIATVKKYLNVVSEFSNTYSNLLTGVHKLQQDGKNIDAHMSVLVNSNNSNVVAYSFDKLNLYKIIIKKYHAEIIKFKKRYEKFSRKEIMQNVNEKMEMFQKEVNNEESRLEGQLRDIAAAPPFPLSVRNSSAWNPQTDTHASWKTARDHHESHSSNSVPEKYEDDKTELASNIPSELNSQMEVSATSDLENVERILNKMMAQKDDENAEHVHRRDVPRWKRSVRVKRRGRNRYNRRRNRHRYYSNTNNNEHSNKVDSQLSSQDLTEAHHGDSLEDDDFGAFPDASSNVVKVVKALNDELSYREMLGDKDLVVVRNKDTGIEKTHNPLLVEDFSRYENGPKLGEYVIARNPVEEKNYLPKADHYLWGLDGGKEDELQKYDLANGGIITHAELLPLKNRSPPFLDNIHALAFEDPNDFNEDLPEVTTSFGRKTKGGHQGAGKRQEGGHWVHGDNVDDAVYVGSDQYYIDTLKSLQRRERTPRKLAFLVPKLDVHRKVQTADVAHGKNAITDRKVNDKAKVRHVKHQ